jgi:hypothetical protein
MAESSMAKISRRSTRNFTRSDGNVENETPESRYGSSNDEMDMETPQGEVIISSSSTYIEAGMIPVVDLGKDLGIFPTSEDMGKHGVLSSCPI